jgi:hypothetical protein
MPILIVASAYLLLFPSRKGVQARFLVPTELRARLVQELPDGPVREKALALLDEFIELARGYSATTESILESYAAHTRSGNFTAASCIEMVQPAERARAATLREIVRIRQQLLGMLPAEQWSALFD